MQSQGFSTTYREDVLVSILRELDPSAVVFLAKLSGRTLDGLSTALVSMSDKGLQVLEARDMLRLNSAAFPLFYRVELIHPQVRELIALAATATAEVAANHLPELSEYLHHA